jgi:demethylmenaquinone methyltransferase/2-methoxy-6-polyprenyl-1,4-benzoquinol methylase
MTEDKSHVQAMFGRIARRYDLMNRLMTLGHDRAWRKFVVQQAQLNNNSRVLDIAAGTGDIAFEVRQQYPAAQVVAADFALPMMQVGQTRSMGQQVAWTGANALALPLPDETFDGVVSGFLFRNVPDIPQTLAEQWRILRPGGRMVTLDTSPPTNPFLRPFINIHFKLIIPLLGHLITGDASAYRYLPESTLAFKTPDEFVALMQAAGFQNVGYRRFMFGTIAVHWGTKP